MASYYKISKVKVPGILKTKLWETFSFIRVRLAPLLYRSTSYYCLDKARDTGSLKDFDATHALNYAL